MTQAACFINCQFNNTFCPGSETNFSGSSLLTTTNNILNSRTDFAQSNTHVDQGFSSDTLFLTNETEKYVFCPDVVVVEVLRFFLGSSKYSTGPFREFFESASH